MRRGLRILAVAGVLFCISQSRADAQADQHSHLKDPPLIANVQKNSADYVGSETCVTCHTAEAKTFDSNPHAKLALEHGGKGVTCESCHGPGKAHVESGGDKTKILDLAGANA